MNPTSDEVLSDDEFFEHLLETFDGIEVIPDDRVVPLTSSLIAALLEAEEAE